MWNSAGSYTDKEFEICSDDRNDEDGHAIDCGGESSRTCLEDDEGFPSFQLIGMDVGGGGSEEADEGSFASSFYRGGADWSCLQLEREEEHDKDDRHVTPLKERKLKQANLLQVWGLKRKEVDGGLKQTNLLQLWGLKRKAVGGGLSASSSSSSASTSSFPMKTMIKKKKNGGVAETSSPTRACPFYKKMPGTPFTVDAFRYGCVEGCSAYFLTHFHADHYGGLSKGWSHGPIYCTPITARLVQMCLYVKPSLIHPLELNEEHIIEGVRITLLDANHCPGAALIHFGLPNGQCYLHTGDFRVSKVMQEYAILAKHRVNLLYLDTTYCNPRYKFPPKNDVLNYVTRITKSYLEKQPKTLVVVGAYSIGKECVYLAISKALGVQIHATASRRRILQSFQWPDLSKRITSNPKDTLLHVLPMSSLRFENLTAYLKTFNNQYVRILAFRPTGWTFSETIGTELDQIKPKSRGNIAIYGVPYSEHSSFTEMQEFVKFLKPEKIIPTVNVGNASNREKMRSHFCEWLKKG